MTLRQKLINEVLDEDRNINRRVVDNLFKQVKVFNDIKQPQTVNNAVSTDHLFTKIDKFADTLLEEIENIEKNETEDIEFSSQLYNSIMMAYKQIVQSNHNAKTLADAKIQTLLPFLNSVVVGLNTLINQEIQDFHFDLDPQTFPFDKDNNIKVCRDLTLYALYLMYRNNIANRNYRIVDLSELNVEFNKLVKTYSVNVRKNIAWGLANSPLAAYRKEQAQTIKDTAERMEAELGRPLTQNERLLLSIRVGGFNEFSPILTNQEIHQLDLHENLDEAEPPAPEWEEGNEGHLVEIPVDQLDPEDDHFEERYANEDAEENEQVQGQTGWNDERNDMFARDVERDEHNREVDEIINYVANNANSFRQRYDEIVIPRAFNPMTFSRAELRQILNTPEGDQRRRITDEIARRHQAPQRERQRQRRRHSEQEEL